MKPTSWIATTAVGAVFGAALVIACSDDSPPAADAAVCDCPAAEPPLAGRIVTVTNPVTVLANSGGGQSVGCPSGGTLLGGGCTRTSGAELIVAQSGPVPAGGGWSCVWRNNIANDAMAIVHAICLVPPQ